MANNIPVNGLTVTLQTDLAIESGTGSSASLMVSLSGALIRFLTIKKRENAPASSRTEVSYYPSRNVSKIDHCCNFVGFEKFYNLRA